VMQKEKEPKDSRKEEVKPDDALKIKYDSIYSEDWPTK
ncbi:MAG: hypothetical protein RL616_1132, partial [Verrucomicrobiota bacterium]